MGYLTDGFDASDMIERVQGVIKGGSDTASEAIALQFLNMAQLEMFHRYDWPELRIQDDYFTTTGADSYSLASVLHSAEKAGFGRVMSDSVRTGVWSLKPITKGWLDQKDSARNSSSTPYSYCAVNRTDFRIWPYGSNGDKII